MLKGTCDCCEARDVELVLCLVTGIETFACAKCCGDKPNESDGDDPVANVRRRILEMEGKMWKCRRCGKTPANIGWCNECGYNRDYELVRSATLQ